MLVVLIAAGVVFWKHHNSQSMQGKKVDDALAASQTAYNKAEYVNALNLVRGMDAQATSKAQKLRVYQAEAQAANAANRLADAAHFYELKHQLDPGTAPADAYTLGNIYQRLNQKEKALAQYRAALDYAKNSRNQYGSDAAAIQADIDALEHQ